MPKLLIDGTEIDVPADYTLLQACEAAGVEIPRFCFHERLSIAGNCRMCLVELKGSPKPVASCAWGVRDCRPGPNGEPPVVSTRSALVKKAREGVMEFLLINHPLDCPICDQGGECDLQDQAMAYGVDTSRFAENKRAVEDKYLGPLIATSMNRCIHCTRCIRFITEVAGVPDLGATGRGEDMEITSYLERALGSELQGNIADLCPVGALTHKPYAFRARPWELSKTESVDIMDAVGSAIRVDARGREVVRILPRINEAVNEEWISDKARHVWDGLAAQRLDRPYIRIDGALRPASWTEAFAAIAKRVGAASPGRIGALAGQLASVEEMFALKLLTGALGSANLDARYPGSPLHPRHGRAGYLFNSTIAGIDGADALTIIGADPRLEAPVLNARIRKRLSRGGFDVALVGRNVDLTYPYKHLGAGPASLQALLDDASAGAAKRPMVLVGQAALNRPDGAAVLSSVARYALKRGAVAEGWNGFNVLHTEAASVGALDIGFVPGEGGLDTGGMLRTGALDVLFLLGVDEVDAPAQCFVIYVGANGDRGAHRADIVLPSAAWTEQSGLYVNTEGRVQIANRATFPPGEAREGWAIFRALSDALGRRLPFDSQSSLRALLRRTLPHIPAPGEIAPADPRAVETLAAIGGAMGQAPFGTIVEEYHLTNALARSSAIMAECSRVRRGATAVAAE